MTKKQTALQKYHILQQKFNAKFDAYETENEWGDKAYEAVVFFPEVVLKECQREDAMNGIKNSINKDRNSYNRGRVDEFLEDGAVACLDQNGVFVSNSFEDAVERAWYWTNQK